MPRCGVTQARSFVYGPAAQSRLLSAANPEDGPVNYVYIVLGQMTRITMELLIDVEYRLTGEVA